MAGPVLVRCDRGGFLDDAPPPRDGPLTLRPPSLVAAFSFSPAPLYETVRMHFATFYKYEAILGHS